MKLLLIVPAILVALVGALYLLGPREPVRGAIDLDTGAMDVGVDTYLFERERGVANLKRGTQKHVRWQHPNRRERTDWAVVYLHGFSASLQEIRPVPDIVADGLEANLFFSRFRGHGRDGPAMADGSVPAWTEDVAEALEIAQRIGDRTVVIGTSTGGTMATLAAFDPRLKDKIDAIVLVSPNFRIQAAGAGALTLPFARTLVPMVVGPERWWAPVNEAHGRWWTTRYPIEAVLPMAAAVRAASKLNYGRAEIPALFLFSEDDQTVDPATTRAVAEAWGAPSEIAPIVLATGDDPGSHVIAGDILSPNQTRPVAERILLWLDATFPAG
ncbi:MAG: alpha/beta fold hydrolase [Pseudomonadota bacterium]